MLVNRNEVVNKGANEVTSVEKTKIDERNITDNRAMPNKNKVKREEKRDGSLEKIDLKKLILNFWRSKVGMVIATSPLHLLFPPTPPN